MVYHAHVDIPGIYHVHTWDKLLFRFHGHTQAILQVRKGPTGVLRRGPSSPVSVAASAARFAP